MSATNIGKKLGLSYQKINKFLTEEGLYNPETQKPTELAINNGLAKIQSTISRFDLKQVEYTAWDFNKLRELFPNLYQQKNQNNSEKKVRKNICRSSGDAFGLISDAFVDFGDMLEIVPGKLKKGISEETQKAVIESYFSDSGFLGGPLLWHRHFKPNEAATAKSITLKYGNELFQISQKIDEKRAKYNLMIIEITMQWLCDMAR